MATGHGVIRHREATNMSTTILITTGYEGTTFKECAGKSTTNRNPSNQSFREMRLRLSSPYFSTLGLKLSPTDNFATLLRRPHQLYCSCKVSGCQQDQGSVCLARSFRKDIHIHVDIVVDIDVANANLNALANYLEE
jgi:hypothetical protein